MACYASFGECHANFSTFGGRHSARPLQLEPRGLRWDAASKLRAGRGPRSAEFFPQVRTLWQGPKGLTNKLPESLCSLEI